MISAKNHLINLKSIKKTINKMYFLTKVNVSFLSYLFISFSIRQIKCILNSSYILAKIKQQNKVMLNKYEQFFKISKDQECSIYTAVSRETGQPVLLKRFKNSKLTWDEVLKNRNMQLSQKSRAFPKMIQIFKNKGDYYVVYQKTSGPSLADAEDYMPLSKQDFYLMFNDLLQHILSLKFYVPGLYVLPEWIFIHRHTVKLLHFEPFFIDKDAVSSDHVFLYKVQNQIVQPEKDEQSQSSIVPLDKKRSIIFNIGMMAYKLLTGLKTQKPQNQDDYLAMVYQISQNAEKRVFKATKDKALSVLVAKMLGNNVFQLPQIDEIANFMSSKAVGITPKKRAHTNYIQIELQHLKLQNLPQQEPTFRRKLRPCCAQKQASIEKINEQVKKNRQVRLSVSRLKEESPRIELKQSKYFLPIIKKGQMKNTKTMMNLMNTTGSKPLMFNQNRSVLF